MNLFYSTFFKCALSVTAILLSVDVAFAIYERQRKRIKKRDIEEVFFLMSDAIPCHQHSSNMNDEAKNCINPSCKGKLSCKLIEHIDSAKHLICIAMYMLTMEYMTVALKRAHQRGVTIRIITDKSMIGSSNLQIATLEEAGIAIRIAGDGDKMMHNKFCLIDVTVNEKTNIKNDHPTNGVVITGSLNWTTNGFRRNWENVLFLSNESIKNSYKYAFDHIWVRLT